MPELYFRVRWPDDSTTHCYSPSTTIRDAFTLGEGYSPAEFAARSRAALTHASARVAAKFGYGCAHAQRQIDEIESRAAQFSTCENARIVVEAFGDDVFALDTSPQHTDEKNASGEHVSGENA